MGRRQPGPRAAALLGLLALAAAAGARGRALPDRRAVQAADCAWTGCHLASSVNPWGGCDDGQTKKDSEGCGCVLGRCAGTRHQCCGTPVCKIWDPVCSWNVIKDSYMDDPSATTKAGYEALSDTVKAKVSDAQDFATLSVAELGELNADVLAHLKSTSGMRTAQLKAVKGTVKDMTKAELDRFLGHVNPTALKGTSGDLGAMNFGATAGDLYKGVKKSLGGPAQFTKSVLNDLGNLVPELPAADLQALPSASLAGATQFAAKLKAAQVVSLGGPLHGLTTANLRVFVGQVPVTELLDSCKDLASVGTWEPGQKTVLAARATAALGDAKNWAVAEAESLGAFLDAVPAATLAKIQDWRFVKMDNLKDLGPATLGGLRGKFSGLSASQFTAAIGQVPAAALEGAMPTWGAAEFPAALVAPLATKLKAGMGDARTWTAAQVDDLGTLLVPVVKDSITDLPAKTFKGCLDRFQQAKDLTTEQAKAVGAKAVDVYGGAETWTKAEVAKVGKFISALDETELPKVRVEFVAALDGEEFLAIDWTLDPNALKKAVPKFGEFKDWSQAQADALIAGYEQAHGAAGAGLEWTQGRVDEVGALIAGIPVAEIRSMGADTLAKAKGAASLTATQLGAAATKLGAMQAESLDAFLTSVDSAQGKMGTLLAAAKVEYGEMRGLAKAQADALYPYVTGTYGAAKDWSAERLDDLEALVALVPVEDLKAVSADALAQAQAAGRLGAAQVHDLAGDLKGWTAANLEK